MKKTGSTAAVLAICVFAAACSSLPGDVNLAAPEADSDALAEEQSENLSEEEAAPASTVQPEPAEWNPDAAYLDLQFSSLVAGSYRVESAGTPFTFTIVEDLFVQPNSYGEFVVTHPASRGPDDQDVVVRRFTELVDPTDVTATLEPSGSSWPADDFAGWLDNLSAQVTVTNREEVILGGQSALRADLELAEDVECTHEWACVEFGTNNFTTGRELQLGAKYRIWMVEQGEEDPVYVFVGIAREEDRGWFETADRVLATMAFGEATANPIQPLAAGPHELSFLGGINVDLPTDLVAVYDPVGRIVANEPFETEFLTNPRDLDGEIIASTDDLATYVAASGVEISEIEPTTVGGLDTRVFDIGSSSEPTPILTIFEDSQAGWGAPPRGRLWIVDHPERGLLVVTAEAFAEADIFFPQALAQTEPILESLEFIDLE